MLNLLEPPHKFLSFKGRWRLIWSRRRGTYSSRLAWNDWDTWLVPWFLLTVLSLGLILQFSAYPLKLTPPRSGIFLGDCRIHSCQFSSGTADITSSFTALSFPSQCSDYTCLDRRNYKSPYHRSLSSLESVTEVLWRKFQCHAPRAALKISYASRLWPLSPSWSVEAG